VNFEAGDFDHTRLYSTAGIAVTSIQWKVARQFAFFENNLTWKRYITVYSSLAGGRGQNIFRCEIPMGC